MAPLLPMEGLASRLIPPDPLSRVQKPPEMSNWLNPGTTAPPMVLNQAPSINDLCNLFEQSEEFLIAINDSKLADIVDNEMKQTNWLDIKPSVIQGLNAPSANIRAPVCQNLTPSQSNPRMLQLLQAPKSSIQPGYRTMAGTWVAGQRPPRPLGASRCLGPSPGSQDPFGHRQGNAPRRGGPAQRMSPPVLSPMEPKPIPGIPSQVLRPRITSASRPDPTFDPRSIRGPTVDEKQQQKPLDTRFRTTINQESQSRAFDFGSSCGLPMSMEKSKGDQMDLDFILQQAAPITPPTFTIKILGEQGM